jgi:hypothetical protein
LRTGPKPTVGQLTAKQLKAIAALRPNEDLSRTDDTVNADGIRIIKQRVTELGTFDCRGRIDEWIRRDRTGTLAAMTKAKIKKYLDRAIYHRLHYYLRLV